MRCMSGRCQVPSPWTPTAPPILPSIILISSLGVPGLPCTWTEGRLVFFLPATWLVPSEAGSRRFYPARPASEVVWTPAQLARALTFYLSARMLTAHPAPPQPGSPATADFRVPREPGSRAFFCICRARFSTSGV